MTSATVTAPLPAYFTRESVPQLKVPETVNAAPLPSSVRIYPAFPMYIVPADIVSVSASMGPASVSDVPWSTTSWRSCGPAEDRSVYVVVPSNLQFAVLPVTSIEPSAPMDTAPAVYTRGLFVPISRSPSVMLRVPLTSRLPDMMMSSSPAAPVLFSVRL